MSADSGRQGPTPDQLARWIAANPEEARLRLAKPRAERSLIEFVELMWPVLEPGRPFARGWAVEAICQVLEDVTNKKIKRAVIAVPPGMAKPVHEEELVLTHRGRIPLREVVEGDRVLTHRGRYRRVRAVHVQGVLPTVVVRTFAGRSVRAAPDHPFLTPRGWIAAGDLRPGDHLAAVAPQTYEQPALVSDEEARLIGYMIGDGCTQYHPGFTNADKEILDDFERCAAAVGIGTRRRTKTGATTSFVSLLGSKPWLQKHNLLGKSSYTKRIPAAVLDSSRSAIANCVGAYWSCDGTISFKHVGKKSSHTASACTVGEGLAHDLQHALLRLGLDARVRPRVAKLRTNRQGEVYRYFLVMLTSHDQVAKLHRMPGLCSRKSSVLDGSPRIRFDHELIEDEVTEVLPADPGPCRCLTVEEDASFCPSDLAAHNSLITNVFHPAWEWGPRNMPHLRHFSSSYSENLTLRDNGRCLKLIQSPQYQTLWGDRVKLDPKKTGERKFALLGTGWKLASSVTGTGTGERGDRVLLDDLLSAQEVSSDAALDTCLQYFTEVIPTRINDDDSAIIVIAQRLHERDPIGHILEHNLPYERLILPMRREEDHPFPSSPRYAGLDPRKPGELLFPERFSEERVRSDEEVMRSWGGEFAVASQMYQRPVPRAGGLFKRDSIRRVPLHEVPPGEDVRGWDLAGSKDGRAAWTVGLKLRRVRAERSVQYYVTDVRRGRWSPAQVRAQILQAAQDDGRACRQCLPQDPGQAGLAQRHDFAAMLDGYDFSISVESGSKEDRARPIAAQAESGNVFVVDAPWTALFLAEVGSFPGGSYKDQVDALSRSHAQLLRLVQASTGAGAEVVTPDDAE